MFQARPPPTACSILITFVFLWCNHCCHALVIPPAKTDRRSTPHSVHMRPAWQGSSAPAARALQLDAINGKTDQEIEVNSNNSSSNMTDTTSNPDLESLEQKLKRLQQEMDEQKEKYDTQVSMLKEQSDVDVRTAQASLESMRSKYLSYKMEMETKLAAAPSKSEVKRMEQDMASLKEAAETQETKLAEAKAELADNLEARKALQAEMVALKHGYLQRLSEIEDQLEEEQDQRVREQQESAKTLERIQTELKQRLKDVVEESRRNVEIITADFTQKLEQRDQELAQTRDKLQTAQDAVHKRESRISELEEERQSLRKLFGISFRLVRQRVSKRLSMRRRRKDTLAKAEEETKVETGSQEEDG